MAVMSSEAEGGKTRKKPWPLINDEKLETQKGMTKRRSVCHLSCVATLKPPTLRISAMPMSALTPMEFNQMDRDESKWWATVLMYQIR